VAYRVSDLMAAILPEACTCPDPSKVECSPPSKVECPPPSKAPGQNWLASGSGLPILMHELRQMLAER
jgi:hypothetical protein